MCKRGNRPTPQVSIVIPAYNAERTIGMALESALGQNLQSIEIICVDDGSRDNTRKIISAYAENDDRIVLRSQSNQGQGAARNVGIGQARGEFIAFLDADDALPKNALKIMLDAAGKYNVDFVASRDFIKVTNHEYLGSLGDSRTTPNITVSDCPVKTIVEDRKLRSSAWNKLYRRRALADLRFPEGIVFEDWPFITLFATLVSRMVVINAPCYVYCSEGPSTVRSSFTDYKIASYAAGIRWLAQRSRGTVFWKYCCRRNTIAASMLINKVCRSGEKELRDRARQEVQALLRESLISFRFMPLKTLIRFLWMRIG